jgi:hypothetical protein
MRLLDAEKREGPNMYLSREPVVERVPPGFVSVIGDLHRSDDVPV